MSPTTCECGACKGDYVDPELCPAFIARRNDEGEEIQPGREGNGWEQ